MRNDEKGTAHADSEDFGTRSRAAQELAELREAAEPALRQALANQTSAEITRQTQKLLDRLVPQAADRLREARAVAVLEQVDTLETRAILKKLARGVPEARLTKEAKASLDRLDKRAGK